MEFKTPIITAAMRSAEPEKPKTPAFVSNRPFLAKSAVERNSMSLIAKQSIHEPLGIELDQIGIVLTHS